MNSRLFWKFFLSFAVAHVAIVVGVLELFPGSADTAPSLWKYLGITSVGLFVLTLWLTRGVVVPVRKLTNSADQMADGDYDAPVYIANRDEMGRLASSFNNMQHKMGSSMSKIRDTNQRMATVLGGMSEGVIAIDTQQQVLFANRAAGEMLEFSPSRAQGMTILEAVRSHTLHDLVVELLESHGNKQVEMEWGEDSPRALLLTGTSFSGVPSAGVVVMIQNLTEEKRLEAMRRDFVANVSHELKTPLSSIKAYAETLGQGAIDDEANRGNFVRQIEEQADRLSQLISDLLSLARIQQNPEPLAMLAIPVGRVVDLCVREQQRAADAKDIQLRTERGKETTLVEADEDGLRQILINLIDNAIKYTPAGGNVTVGWSEGEDEITLQVADTGIGIPEEMLPRVFERFFRVDKARSRELGGTGLGLAIVKHLAQNYGGSVEVTSRLGEGTTFRVRLPYPAASPISGSASES